MARKTHRKTYRLSFGNTRAKRWASTKKQAVADARYWLSVGQMKVCIDRKLPTGTMKRVKCLKRKGVR
jgi:hypothetical protein